MTGGCWLLSSDGNRPTATIVEQQRRIRVVLIHTFAFAQPQTHRKERRAPHVPHTGARAAKRAALWETMLASSLLLRRLGGGSSGSVRRGAPYSSLLLRQQGRQQRPQQQQPSRVGRLLSTAAAATSAANPFPSLVISSKGVTASGSFAQAQATYLNPDKDLVRELDRMLAERRVGLVAHYYMDPELQGTLSALSWPHVFVADSLAMGEAAAKMAATGEVDAVLCMGVDFMAESVRATLDANALKHIPVYRLAEAKIGCSLAEAAEKQAYGAFLHQAAKVPKSLHVVYINTSLVTKAQAQETVPTITCTSSNVLQTVLQAYAQIPGLRIWYGPDSYMGENLHTLLSRLSRMSDAEVQAVHKQHTAATIRELLPRFHYFKQGNCIVHHLFGHEVVQRVKEHYADAFHTAHLEVPGEMFELAMEAQHSNKGVVGSTSNILSFILSKTREAVAKKEQGQRLRFVLGTEAGMVTSIVRGVEAILKEDKGEGSVEVEVIFPVASEAVSQTGEGKGSDLALVPGVQGGEGCSTAGGCATCPYMKMNSLEALVEVLERCPAGGNGSKGSSKTPAALLPFLPPRRGEGLLASGRAVGEVGRVPIVHMRTLMATGKLSEELVNDVLTRPGNGGGGAEETQQRVAEG